MSDATPLLHTETRFVRRLSEQREFTAAFLLEAPSHRHLADEHACAEFDAEASERQVGAFGHRSDNQGARDQITK